MGSRWNRLFAEGGRFLAVGGVATLVALVVFNLLVHGFAGTYSPPLAGYAIAGYVIGHTVGMLVSYTGNRVWAFRERETVHADGGVTAFFVINTVTMALPVMALLFSQNVLGLTDAISDNVAANLVGQPLGLVARFYLFRRFVFRRPVPLVHMNEPPDAVDEFDEVMAELESHGPGVPRVMPTDPSRPTPARQEGSARPAG